MGLRMIPRSNMLNPRESHVLCAVNAGYIYAIGHRYAKKAHLCEAYNIEKDFWEEAPNLNQGRYYCSAVAMNQRFIYVFGGFFKNNEVTSIERLDCFITYTGWVDMEV